MFSKAISSDKAKVFLSSPKGYIPICFLLLFLNFSFNIFSFAPHFWFNEFDKTSESLVIGGLVHKRIGLEDSSFLGRFSDNGALIGYDLVDYQYKLALNADYQQRSDYVPYVSQLGIQVPMTKPLYFFLDRLSERIGGKKVGGLAGLGGNLGAKFQRNKIAILKLQASFFNALMLCLFLAWFYFEFGSRTGWFCLGTALLGGWLTVFASSLYWIIGSWFIPFIIVAWIGYFLQKTSNKSSQVALIIAGTCFYIGAMLFKCLMGYEYLSTICLSAAIPVVYYGLKAGRSLLSIFGMLIVLALFSIVGFGVALYLHIQSLAPILGDSGAMETLKVLILKSTHPVAGSEIVPERYNESLSANIVFVLLFYILSPLNKDAFFLAPVLLVLPGIIACIKVFRKDSSLLWNGRQKSLAWAALFSLSAPLSWFILAKAHSATHFHYNFVLWYLPALFFMTAIISEVFFPKTIIKKD